MSVCRAASPMWRTAGARYAAGCWTRPVPFGAFRTAPSARGLASSTPQQQQQIQAARKVQSMRPRGTQLQRSHTERKPKLMVMAMAFGIAAGTVSTIMFFENDNSARCDASETDSFAFSKESVTGVRFPVQLSKYSSPDSTHWLVTKTVRCMLNFCQLERARAYAYAVYFSSEATLDCADCTTLEEMTEILLPQRALEAEQEQELSKAEAPAFIPAPKFQGAKHGYYFGRDETKGGLGYHLDESGLINSLATHPYPSLCLRLVMLREVDGGHIAHGFDRSLLQRIRSAQGGNRGGTGKEALRELNYFVERFNGGIWPKGTILEFLRLPEGRVDVRVNGQSVLTLQSESFSWAVFDAYLGKKGHLGTPSRLEIVERTKEVADLLKEHA